MFGLGFWEIAIILGVALLVLGPSKLPELARGLGKGLREFRKATEDFKSTIDEEVYRPDPPKPVAPPAHALPPAVEAKAFEPAPAPLLPTEDPLKRAEAEAHAAVPSDDHAKGS